MKNFIQSGKVITIPDTHPAVVSGQPILVGGLFGIMAGDVAENESGGEIVTEGVFTLAKKTGIAVAFGDRLYWDDTAKTLTPTATADAPHFVGIATGAELSAAETVACSLNEGGVPSSADEVVAAVTDTSGGSGNAGKLVKLDGDGKLDGRDLTADAVTLAAAVAALALIKSGTLTIAAGASAGTAALGAASWAGKPCAVSLQGSAGDGLLAAATPTARAVISGSTLTVTLLDKDGVATVNASSGAQTWSYLIDGR